MADEHVPQKRAPRRRLSTPEKRRIVDLTFRPGASVVAVAREHGVLPNTVYRWRGKHRVDQASGAVTSPLRDGGSPSISPFVPITLIPAVHEEAGRRADAAAFRDGALQLVLASGATLRVETAALDAAFVCAVVAELRR